MSDKKGPPKPSAINNIRSKLDNLIKSSTTGKQGKSLTPANISKMITEKLSELLKSSMTDKQGQKLKPTQVAYNFGTQLVNLAQTSIAEQQKGPRRPMKFPYTYSAKLAQFPWMYYYKNQWIWRYYFYAVIICIPVFKYFSRISNSPNNVKVWKEIRRQEHAHH